MVGTCFIIVGNSGSGKDSLISWALSNYPKDARAIYIPKRFITRPPHESEPFISVSPEEFQEKSKRGDFVLEWHIYGLSYGLGYDVVEKLNEGYNAIINISRTVIPDAKRKIPNCKVIFVKVPFETTMERVKTRGRENENDPVFKERIERAKNMQDLPDADFVVENTGTIEEGGKKLLDYLLRFI
jgi:ribose 1,5-bisphosphokinase